MGYAPGLSWATHIMARESEPGLLVFPPRPERPSTGQAAAGQTAQPGRVKGRAPSVGALLCGSHSKQGQGEGGKSAGEKRES